LSTPGEHTDRYVRTQPYDEVAVGLSHLMEISRDNAIAIARLDEQAKGALTLFLEREKQVNLAFASSEKAVAKAEEAQQRVNEGQNEFRGALKDQAGTFATKDEVLAVKELLLGFPPRGDVTRLDERLGILEKVAAVSLGGSQSLTAARVAVVSIIGAVVGLLTFGLLALMQFRTP
jgi:hypothetical protein